MTHIPWKSAVMALPDEIRDERRSFAILACRTMFDARLVQTTHDEVTIDVADADLDAAVRLITLIVEGADPHRACVAAKLGIALEAVTHEQRAANKLLFFGALYGKAGG